MLRLKLHCLNILYNHRVYLNFFKLSNDLSIIMKQNKESLRQEFIIICRETQYTQLLKIFPLDWNCVFKSLKNFLS